MRQVSANVFVETGFQGCNPGFVMTRGGIVMIDSPQRPSDARKWRDEVKRKGEIRYLINTEPHADHVMGNFFFPGLVISHQGTRDALSQFSIESVVERVKAIDPESLSAMEGYVVKKPSITFSYHLSLYLGDHIFELMHLPGHTASQIGVYISKEKVIFTGDNVSGKVQTFLHQAYPDEWLQSLRRIEELDVDMIVPGHGEVCNKPYLKEQISFIEEWVEAVKEAIRQGLSKEEAQSKISFLDRYPMDVGLEARGTEFQRMSVGRLYDIFTKP